MTANATDPTALASVPTARLFQLDSAGTGELRNCVNLFRGAVALPLQLVSLRGRGGLDVDVTISYGSDIEPFAGTWNATAPTSIILGLGWSLPADMVMRSALDPAAPDECTLYLLHSGDAEELICTGQDDTGRLTYILRNYQFWRRTHDTRLLRRVPTLWRADLRGGFSSPRPRDRTVGGVRQTPPAIHSRPRWPCSLSTVTKTQVYPAGQWLRKRSGPRRAAISSRPGRASSAGRLSRLSAYRWVVLSVLSGRCCSTPAGLSPQVSSLRPPSPAAQRPSGRRSQPGSAPTGGYDA